MKNHRTMHSAIATRCPGSNVARAARPHGDLRGLGTAGTPRSHDRDLFPGSGPPADLSDPAGGSIQVQDTDHNNYSFGLLVVDTKSDGGDKVFVFPKIGLNQDHRDWQQSARLRECRRRLRQPGNRPDDDHAASK